jgi:uncharacterized protein DUF3386
MFRWLHLAVTCSLLGLASVRADEPKTKAPSDPAAALLMQEAHRARGGWDATFPGFTCKLVAVVNGTETTGRLAVTAEGKLKIELPAGPINDWAAKQLESLVSHRMTGERSQYDVTFADTEMKHPLGRLIKFAGAHNFYRIKGDVITEVHRSMGEGKFTISVTDVARNAEGKYLPRSYNVSFWDGAGNLVRHEDYLEDYARVGKYDVPTRRLQIKTAKGERVVGELRMSEHVLMPVK